MAADIGHLLSRKSTRGTASAVGLGGGPVDGRLPTPLYHQIYVILRDQILNGTYRVGSRIPSEHDLAEAYGVSRITARRAVDELAADGVVLRYRGRGTLVAEAPKATTPIQGNLHGLLENLIAMGLQTKVTLLAFGYEEPPEDVRRALEVGAGEDVQKAIRVRHLENAPLSYLTTYVPAHIGRSFDRDDMVSLPLLTLLERCGVEVTGAEQTITATLADATVAPALDVDIGSPLLGLTRVVRGQGNAPVEYINALYRPDQYQYHITLSRDRSDGDSIWSPAYT